MAIRRRFKSTSAVLLTRHLLVTATPIVAALHGALLHDRAVLIHPDHIESSLPAPLAGPGLAAKRAFVGIGRVRAR